MAFLDRILEPPSYGYVTQSGQLYKPGHLQLLKEFLSRVNPFISIKNWLPFFGWFMTLSLMIPLYFFFSHFFNWKFLMVGFAYAMVFLGTFGTVWLHRYSTHRSFQIRNSIWKFIIRNMVIKVIPEEIYVLSHHVHHSRTEKPGDPYNVYGGWLYCFLADANHQLLSRNLSQSDYQMASNLMSHTGVHLNSYKQYLKWGSLCHPAYTILHYALNWGFWYGVFFLMGGNSLAIAIFGMSAFWAIGVRTYNFDGHGKGSDKHKSGSDFHLKDLSVNQFWPGFVAGEWHNNHHLYPNSARAGFLPYQLDLAFFAIKAFSKIGAVTSYRDFKGEFLAKYNLPYLRSVNEQKSSVLT